MLEQTGLDIRLCEGQATVKFYVVDKKLEAVQICIPIGMEAPSHFKLVILSSLSPIREHVKVDNKNKCDIF